MRLPIRVTVALVTTLVGSFAAPVRAADATTTTTIRYDGTSISVPSSWPVYNLAEDPTRCVRFDRHAVYLGHPGADQRCPAHAVGRTAALLVEPYDRQSQVLPGDADSGTTQAVSGNGRVLITASYGAGGPQSARAALRGTALRAAPPSPTAPALAAPGPTAPTPASMHSAVAGTGYAFDTCAAPSTASMKAWSNTAPYDTVAIYVGGVNRACGYGNLNSSWVTTVSGYGYHFIPTYVGRQAPCSGIGVTINTNPALATIDGKNAAVDAIHGMERLGLGPRDPIYLDLEHYSGEPACRHSVLRFVDAWVYRLHESGYLAGVYSSNLADLVGAYGASGFHEPDAIWIAHWDGRASVYGEPAVPDRYWNPHRRLHQYRGPHDQIHGGVLINIDTSYLDGPVA